MRNLGALDLRLCSGVNIFWGANGSGKTSLLEAIYLLGMGRSFRTRTMENCIADGSDFLRLEAELADDVRLVLARDRKGEQRTLCGANPVRNTSEMVRAMPLLLVDTDSLRMLGGEPERRRRFINSGAFHMSQQFASDWQDYQRGLRQRNAALKSFSEQSMAPWEELMSQTAERIVQVWESWLNEFRTRFEELMRSSKHPRLEGMLEGLHLDISPGWDTSRGNLQEALIERRERDCITGYSSRGPHRADLVISLSGGDSVERISAGERKLLACAMLLAQGDLMTAQTGQHPIYLIDDLCAELDRDAARVLLTRASGTSAQLLSTCIAEDELNDALPQDLHRQSYAMEELNGLAA